MYVIIVSLACNVLWNTFHFIISSVFARNAINIQRVGIPFFSLLNSSQFSYMCWRSESNLHIISMKDSAYGKKARTYALAFTKHRGQFVRFGPHSAQAARCPQGRNTMPTSLTLHPRHWRKPDWVSIAVDSVEYNKHTS